MIKHSPVFLTAASALFLFLLSGCATMGQKIEPVTVNEVVALSKRGLPSDQIIQKMRDSHAVYRLSASELAKLHDQGVPDPVLDYMQQTYINDIRLDEMLLRPSYPCWGPWPCDPFWSPMWPYRYR